MKNKIILTALIFFISSTAFCQLVYKNADELLLMGKISENTETRYERLPKNLKKTSRPPVWELGKNTAGLAIRFCTNSKSIGVKWSLFMNRYMNHMTPTGAKGLDLYKLEGDKWTFVNSVRPNTEGFDNEMVVKSNMKGVETEYMLYLPLYDGIKSLSIGVDSTAFISNPKVDLPKTDNPIIAYGTSILQGACASRAGMAHTNILSRELNHEIINLGFSGNGQLDYEIAEIMADRKAALYILDFMPNVNAQQVNEKLEKFYNILRVKAPNTPILFIENPSFPQAKDDEYMTRAIADKNKALNEKFKEFKDKGDQNIYLLPFGDMIGMDNEATIDGIHFTDLGFSRYSENLLPIIKLLMDK